MRVTARGNGSLRGRWRTASGEGNEAQQGANQPGEEGAMGALRRGVGTAGDGWPASYSVTDS